MESKKEFNWYSIVGDDESITQGDIFLNIPIIECANYREYLLKEKSDEFKPKISIQYIDCIVLTQPCDLEQSKVDLKDVIVCRIHNNNDDGVKFGKGKLIDIIEGKRPQFYLLNKNDEFKYDDGVLKLDNFNFYIVNFDEIDKIPVSALKQYASKIHKRLRLLPPYREHLSQAFAKYFMRIGLPSDIDRSTLPTQ